MGFEPTRAEHIGLAVQRLNLSATASLTAGRTNPSFESGILLQYANTDVIRNYR